MLKGIYIYIIMLEPKPLPVGTALSLLDTIKLGQLSAVSIQLENIGGAPLNALNLEGILNNNRTASPWIPIRGPFHFLSGHPTTLEPGESCVVGCRCSQLSQVRINASATADTELLIHTWGDRASDGASAQPMMMLDVDGTESRPFGIAGALAFVAFGPHAPTTAKLQRLGLDGVTWVDTGLDLATVGDGSDQWDSARLALFGGLFGQIDNLRIAFDAAVAGQIMVSSRPR